MRLFLMAAMLVIVLPGWSQEHSISLGNDDTGEGVLIRRASFDGNSLWGYINGGADLYLEYGFDNVSVHEIEFRSNIIRFDLYRMSDPKAAFGIYSVYSFMCDSLYGPGEYNCGTRWQLQSVKGNYYLSVILSGGTPDEYIYASTIAAKLLSYVKDARFEPGFPFCQGVFNTVPGKIRFSRGALGLENGISDMVNFLRDFPTAEVWHIEHIPEAPEYTATAITFSSSDDLILFKRNLSAGGNEKLRIIINEDGQTILLISGSGNSVIESKISGWFETY